MGAIEKINAEMQKEPDNQYLEIIGQYVIDRCADSAVELAVSAKDKTLDKALEAVKASAKKKAKHSVAVLSPSEVFGVVDKYFGIPKDEKAQYKALGFDTTAPSEAPKVSKESNTINLSDFL